MNEENNDEASTRCPGCGLNYTDETRHLISLEHARRMQPDVRVEAHYRGNVRVESYYRRPPD